MNGKSPARGLAHQGLSKEKFATECVWWLGFSRMFSFFPFVMVCVPPSPVISCGERGGHKRGGLARKGFTVEGYGISAKHFTAPQTLPGLGKPWAAQPATGAASLWAGCPGLGRVGTPWWLRREDGLAGDLPPPQAWSRSTDGLCAVTRGRPGGTVPGLSLSHSLGSCQWF